MRSTLAQSTVLALMLIGIAPARAQSTNLPRREITLPECIDLALEHNFDVRIERYNPEIARFVLSGDYGAYDPVFNFHAQRGVINEPSIFDPKKTSTNYAYELITDSVGAGIGGRLPTGLTYDVGANSDLLTGNTDFSGDFRNRFLFPPDGFRHTNEYYLTTAITLRQPLLKDLWTDRYRQEIAVNKKNLKMSDMALRRVLMSTIATVEQTYYELVFARESVKMQEKAVELANLLLTVTHRRVQVGELPPLEEKQVEAEVESARAALFLTQQLFGQQQNALRGLITDNLKEWIDVDLQPRDTLLALPEPLDREESWQYALKNRPDLAQLRLEVEKQQINIDYRLNQLFPSVDVVGSYGTRAAEHGFGVALNETAEATRPAYAYGVVVGIPLGNISARNNYKASKAAKSQAKLQLEKLQQSVLLEVDTAIKDGHSTRKRVESTRLSRLFSEAALAAEQRKLEAGNSTPFIVLQFQEKLAAAQSAEMRALADYNHALTRLALSEGRTLEKRHLSVQIK